ncbi:elongation factor P-like protein EfpL [Methylovulum miyakonense]|uniref:elongation factor P-like protein EfpL n=1 Tax=Methylovulum miyakonense TaxID=645578 RepID=UPI000376D47C|nr:elongation factor P-like protein YeiP [Methylovulum miyakonense]
MAKASDLKRGMVVDINGVPHIVKNVDVKSPSSRGATTLYKVRFTNMKTGLKLDESLKGDDMFKDAELVRAKVQYSYKDGDNFVFMNSEDYTQYTLGAEDLEGQAEYLSESLEGIVALLIDDEPIGLELPATVILEIIETPPPIKGSSASARTKTARLSTGLEVQVPEYLETGELIKVNTETGKYSSRA